MTDHKDTKSSDGIIQKYVDLLLEDEHKPKRQIWCSFADLHLPEGSQFLGVVVVEAQSPAWATHELNARGLNLGGEILFYEIPPDRRIPEEWMYRVMNKEEAESCPVILI